MASQYYNQSRHATRKDKVPEGEHFAILTFDTSRDYWDTETSYTSYHSVYTVYDTEEAWKAAIKELAFSKKDFVPLKAIPAKFTVNVDVEV